MDWFLKLFQIISNWDLSLSSLLPTALLIYLVDKILPRIINLIVAEKYRLDKSIKNFAVSERGAISFERFQEQGSNEKDLINPQKNKNKKNPDK